MQWHQRKIANRRPDDPTFVCPRCSGLARPLDGRPVSEIEVDGAMLESVDQFCYLGDMLDAGGGCDTAIATRCCVAWVMFRQLLPIVASRHLSPKVRGRVYEAGVRSAMLHGSETWGPTLADLQRLRRNDRAMIRWMWRECDEVSSDDLLSKLGISETCLVLRKRRLN